MPSATRKPRSPCPIALSLDLFGDRWTLLILRDLLLFDKRRFRDFLHSPEAIASNILADRLKRLETHGFVHKSVDDADRRKFIYTPTDKARTVETVLLEIAAWGALQDGSGAFAAFADRYYADREPPQPDHRVLFAAAVAGPD